MKTIISIACLVLVASMAASAEAKDKRSVVYAAAAPVAVAHTVPVAAAAVVHSNPTTVVKTEQVHDGVQSSYSYSTEVKSHPVAAAVAAPAAVAHVAAAPAVAAYSTVHHAVPTYAYSHYGYYPAHYAYPYAYSPYSYVVGK